MTRSNAREIVANLIYEMNFTRDSADSVVEQTMEPLYYDTLGGESEAYADKPGGQLPYIRDAVRGIHLTGRRAGAAAREAGVRRLALTHIPPWSSRSTIRAEACTEFSGPIDVAEPGASWTL